MPLEQMYDNSESETKGVLFPMPKGVLDLQTDIDLQLYFQDLEQYPVGYSAEEERALHERITRGGDDGAIARNLLIEANLRLVVNVAKKYKYGSVSILDLIQVGNEGLMHAVDKFDPERGRFTTCAHVWIRQYISRAYAEIMRTVQVPVHYWERIVKVK